jgi:signal transduction histidine kinase
MSWLVAVSLANTVSLLIIIVVHVSTWRQSRLPGLRLWAVGWAIYTIRFLALIGELLSPQTTLWRATSLATLGLSSFLLWAGTRAFTGHPLARWKYTWGLLPVIWALLVFAPISVDYDLLFPPALFFSALVDLFTARSLYTYNQSLGRRGPAWTLSVIYGAWAAMKVSYIFMLGQSLVFMLEVVLMTAVVLALAFSFISRSLAEAERRARRRAERVDAMAAIMSAANRMSSPDELLAAALDEVARLLDIEGGLSAFTLADKELKLIAGKDPAEFCQLVGEPRSIPSDCPCDEALASGRVTWHRSVRGAQTLGFESVVAVPIQARDRGLGVICAALPEGRAPSDGEQQALEALGQQLGTALENAKLVVDMERELDRLQSLTNVSRHMTLELDMHTAMEGITHAAQDTLGADRLALYLRGDASNHTRVAFSKNLSQSFLDDTLARPNDYPELHTIKDNEMVWYRDAQQASDMPPLQAMSKAEGFHSVTVLSLVHSQQFLGTLVLFHDVVRTYSTEDRQFCRALADQVSMVVLNTHLFAEQQRRAEEANLLLEIANAASSTLELDDILKTVALYAARVCEAERCTILLLDQSGKTLIPTMSQLASGNDEELWAMFRDVRYPQPVEDIPEAVTLIQDRQPLYVPNAARSTLPRHWVDPFSVGSILAVPLISRERAIGVMALDRPEVNSPFSSDQIRLAMTIGAQAAVAVENARLYQETTMSLAQTRVLREVMLSAASTLDFDQVLRRTFRTIWKHMEIDFIGFAIPDEAAGYLEYHPSRIGDDALPDRLDIPMDDSVCGLVFQTGEPMVMGDVREVAFYHSVMGEIRSELALPVSIGERIIGILNVESRRANAFGEDDATFYTAIAGQLGVALKNADMYQREQLHSRELEVQSAQLTKTLEELQALDRLRDEVVQNVSHELRTPLTLIQGYTELLLSGDLGESPEAQKRTLELIYTRTLTLAKLIQNLRILRTVSGREMILTPISVADTVSAAADDYIVFAEQAKSRITLDIPDGLPLVLGSVEHLRIAFSHLIDNAIKFSPEGGEVKLTAWANEYMVHISVQDQGIGIDPQHLEHIFERFYQADGSTTRKFGGMGIGLALVWEIVEAHDGTVTVDSKPSVGSTFTVTLPQAGEEQ